MGGGDIGPDVALRKMSGHDRQGLPRLFPVSACLARGGSGGDGHGNKFRWEYRHGCPCWWNYTRVVAKGESP